MSKTGSIVPLVPFLQMELGAMLACIKLAGFID